MKTKEWSFLTDNEMELWVRMKSLLFLLQDTLTISDFPVGHVLMSVNGIPVTGQLLEDGRDVFELLQSPDNYPLSLKFGRPKMTTNEKIFLASMFYPLFAIASQLSPEPKSSGIEVLETDTFKLHCFQTLTGKWLLSFSIAECSRYINEFARRCQVYDRRGAY